MPSDPWSPDLQRARLRRHAYEILAHQTTAAEVAYATGILVAGYILTGSRAESLARINELIHLTPQRHDLPDQFARGLRKALELLDPAGFTPP